MLVGIANCEISVILYNFATGKSKEKTVQDVLSISNPIAAYVFLETPLANAWSNISLSMLPIFTKSGWFFDEGPVLTSHTNT
jgi:hypothetical protein